MESWAQYATEKGGGLIVAMKIPIAGLYFCYHTSEADLKGHLCRSAVTACMAMPTTKKEKHIILKKICKEWS